MTLNLLTIITINISVPRYRERTIMLLYMVVINCISIILTFTELCYMSVIQIKKNSEEREVVLRHPHSSPSKWSHSTGDTGFNEGGKKDCL